MRSSALVPGITSVSTPSEPLSASTVWETLLSVCSLRAKPERAFAHNLASAGKAAAVNAWWHLALFADAKVHSA